MGKMVANSMQHILSLSYGKDSIACLGAIEKLGLPLDRIITAEVWATDTIPADLPPMVEFKAKADEIIKKRWGITVEHVSAGRTYEQCFYRILGSKSTKCGEIYGFPMQKGAWCNDRLKTSALSKVPKGAIQYWGIAADEPERIARHSTKQNIILPLAQIGWTEVDCRKWCEENDLLSPIYTTATRGGCWFCHNQSVNQLRLLRKNYPGYWALLLKWDDDSPAIFHPDGHTVHDFDKRFQLEDEGFLSADDKIFRWSMLDDELNYRWF